MGQIATYLFALWKQAYQAAVDRDLKAFNIALGNFNQHYRRASVADQGEYHFAVADFMKS